MRKFKGFWVPRADPQRVIYNKQAKGQEGRNIRQTACFRSMVEDCEKVGRGQGRCRYCLLFCYSTKEQQEAFNEWFKNKGKVKYD